MAKRLYFIWDGDKYVKIGASEDPERRLKQLQTSSPRRLRLVGWLPFGAEDDESYAHDYFDDERVMGEWFRLAGEIRGFLEWAAHETDAGEGPGPFQEAICGYAADQVLADRHAGLLYDQNEWAHAVQRRAGA